MAWLLPLRFAVGTVIVSPAFAFRITKPQPPSIIDVMKSSLDVVLTSEAMRLLRVSIPTLRRMEARGEIHPVRTGNYRLYDRAELVRVAAERAARAKAA